MKAQRNTSTALLSSNLGARWGWVVNSITWVLYLQKRAPVPNVQEGGWAPGPVWTNVMNRKYLNLTGI